jgi:hypothetical protein
MENKIVQRFYQTQLCCSVWRKTKIPIPAGILKYSEELKQGPNTETCPPYRRRHLRLAG